MIEVSFRVIPVIDIQNGLVVHARGGDRRGYRPFSSSFVTIDPDPLAVVKKLREFFGFNEVYIADLDAIASGHAASTILPLLVDFKIKVIADLGLKDQGDIDSMPVSLPSVSLILATETLRGPGRLESLMRSNPTRTFIFSLDLRHGKPLVAPGSDWQGESPGRLVERAMNAGLNRILLLDLTRVGTQEGTSLFPLVESLTRQHESIEIYIGGGIAGINEILRWNDAGIAGVLVGSALHGGQIIPSDLARLRS